MKIRSEDVIADAIRDAASGIITALAAHSHRLNYSSFSANTKTSIQGEKYDELISNEFDKAQEIVEGKKNNG